MGTEKPHAKGPKTFRAMAMIVATVTALACPTQAAAGDWQYANDEDKMRGERLDYAQLTSLNSVDFDFPYNGGSTLQIGVRKKNGKLDAVMLLISSGQILCGVSSCKGAMKFDNGPVEDLSLVEPNDYSSTIVFVDSERAFLNKLLHSTKLIIELSFYEAGKKQFEFDVRGLKQ